MTPLPSSTFSISSRLDGEKNQKIPVSLVSWTARPCPELPLRGSTKVTSTRNRSWAQKAVGVEVQSGAAKRLTSGAAVSGSFSGADSAAMDELEGILERIEGEEIDIDRLAEELRRAAVLLDLCRGKIRKAEVEVTQIVQSLEGPETDPA